MKEISDHLDKNAIQNKLKCKMTEKEIHFSIEQSQPNLSKEKLEFLTENEK